MSRLKEYPRDLHDQTLHDLQIRVDLHSTAGGSDKVYILTVVKHRTIGSYQVICYNGRRGHGLTTQPYGTYPHYSSALNDMRRRQREKEGKGYKFIHEENASTGTATTAGQTPNSSITTVGLPGIAVATPPKIKEVNGIGKTVLGKLASLKSMPNVKQIDPKKFSGTMAGQDWILMQLPNTDFYYAFLQNNEWILYDAFDTTRRPVPEFFPFEFMIGIQANSHGGNLDGLGFMGVIDQGRFLIIDLISIPGLDGRELIAFYRNEWRARRSMMNVVYDQLYPGIDPYDPASKLRFIDYEYDDKMNVFMGHTGTFAAFNVTYPLNGAVHVTKR